MSFMGCIFGGSTGTTSSRFIFFLVGFVLWTQLYLFVSACFLLSDIPLFSLLLLGRREHSSRIS